MAIGAGDSAGGRSVALCKRLFSGTIKMMVDVDVFNNLKIINKATFYTLYHFISNRAAVLETGVFP